MQVDIDDVVGYVEIAARAQDRYGTQVPADTVRSWEKRRKAWAESGRPARSAARPNHEPLPDPLPGEINGSPVWLWSTIWPWLERTGKVTPAE
ncbi:hypothetical protein Aph01nite_81120 [Acrocarpospora phusangensis]|uniref:Uncharacterized protein n=1 Tax=Acrocarpospora phusangensis TaxID=1070424 RepID=A0A919QPD6_9ACTN|nr:hypothetical protein [Acrocarpospora phusangensis]GIH29802.1 hypothetical protein Aph01nite_81120 [Acrocarpospora phusangensis]